MKTPKYTLLVMAAGMGSRYGKLKQLDYMSDQNDILMDFSIRDAIDAGFNKIVFVIKSSFKAAFVEMQEKKLSNQPVSLHYVCQDVDAIPHGHEIDPNREKPWGTGHAVLVAKEVIHEPFVAINADDFYGKLAFEKIFATLQTMDVNTHQMCMVGYLLKNTVSDNGYVSRGECFVKDNHTLKGIIERTHIEKNGKEIFWKDKEGKNHEMSPETTVSMNFWGFTPKFFHALEKGFNTFLSKHSKDLKSEYFMPSTVNDLLESGEGSVSVLISDATWMGITYRKDKKHVYKAITKMKSEGIYSKNLWER